MLAIWNTWPWTLVSSDVMPMAMKVFSVKAMPSRFHDR